MNDKHTTSMLICTSTSNDRILELIDKYTLEGEIVLLSCYNILDFSAQGNEVYMDMDKEKINISDKLIVVGEVPTNNSYINTLIEYGKNLGKLVYYTESK